MEREREREIIERILLQGVHFAVAAGNEAQDACNVSPASATEW